MLGVLSAQDYEPFLEQFKLLDKSGDGRLTKDDLKALHEQNLERHKEQQQKKHEEQTVHRAMMDCAGWTMIPSGICCLSFVWNNLIGYTLLTGGLLNGVAIGCVLNGASSHARLHGAACLAILATISEAIAICFVFIFVGNPRYYYDMDGLLELTSFSYLDRYPPFRRQREPYESPALHLCQSRIARACPVQHAVHPPCFLQ